MTDTHTHAHALPTIDFFLKMYVTVGNSFTLLKIQDCIRLILNFTRAFAKFSLVICRLCFMMPQVKTLLFLPFKSKEVSFRKTVIVPDILIVL